LTDKTQIVWEGFHVDVGPPKKVLSGSILWI
jgi:hypothetical protein